MHFTASPSSLSLLALQLQYNIDKAVLMFNKSGEEIEDCLNRSDCNVCWSKTMEDEKKKER